MYVCMYVIQTYFVSATSRVFSRALVPCGLFWNCSKWSFPNRIAQICLDQFISWLGWHQWRDEVMRRNNLSCYCVLSSKTNSVLDGFKNNLFEFIKESMSAKMLKEIKFEGVKNRYSYLDAGGSSRVLEQWQKRPFYPEMFGHMGWTEPMNQMIL